MIANGTLAVGEGDGSVTGRRARRCLHGQPWPQIESDDGTAWLGPERSLQQTTPADPIDDMQQLLETATRRETPSLPEATSDAGAAGMEFDGGARDSVPTDRGVSRVALIRPNGRFGDAPEAASIDRESLKRAGRDIGSTTMLVALTATGFASASCSTSINCTT